MALISTLGVKSSNLLTLYPSDRAYDFGGVCMLATGYMGVKTGSEKGVWPPNRFSM